ncbi:HD domain-containing phosphohydrolase [Clostridium merdae]|uniref:HD domain-containing phosphohydrolase n=1 Tax=Clostridium merdae TaxID=1958780 RepID=UPI000A26D593|nr:HD domain-containing phosphohydrolase [Clostridium merdae]
MEALRNQEEPLKTSNYIQTMERLLQVVQQLSAAHDIHTVMNLVRHSVRDLTQADGATFVLREEDDCFYAQEDAIFPLWQGKRFPIQSCISGWVMLNRSPVIIEDVYSDPRIPIEAYKNTFVKSLAMVPIKTIEPIGAIGCYWAKQHYATPEQLKVLQVLADSATIALDNIHYQNIFAEKTKQLENAIDGTLLAIANMVEQKDLYTAGHQKRVATIGLAIAQELGCSLESCEKVFRAGVVHDIGKIGIPSELLAKPAKLTDIEYALIKTHAEIGYIILKDVPLLSVTAEIILQHHERYNGSGYPNGLKGNEILPEAQILAVADVFESMISHRPYRAALGVDAAIDELVQNKGILYHPDIVDAIVHLVKTKGYKIPE